MMDFRNFWRKRGVFNYLLAPLAVIFGGAVALRRMLYRRGILTARRVPAAVVVVGGITAGGGGKTPLTIALIHALRDLGKNPGVVSRGYGAAAAKPRMVAFDANPADCGDEPLLIRRQTSAPVCVCRDRAAAAFMLLRESSACDVIISDDGMQHYALARDYEIAAIDADYQLGNGALLPAGPLRERPLRLAECDAVAVRAADFLENKNGDSYWPPGVAADKIFRIKTSAGDLYRIGEREKVIPPEALAGKKIAAVAGVASPESFFAAARSRGLVLSQTVALADHGAISPAALRAIDAAFIVMSEKDAVKCDSRDNRLLALTLKTSGATALAQAIADKIDGRQTS
jgi:tetraacyldisaccharide 4'-kinase